MIATLIISYGSDLEQAKRHADLKSECDSTMAHCNLIIKDQKAKAVSLRKKRMKV